MNEQTWLKTKASDYLRFCPTQVSERKLRLFACACARCLLSFGDYPDCRQALEIAEGMAEGAVGAERIRRASDRVDYLSRTLATTYSYVASAAWAALLREPFLAARFAQNSLTAFEVEAGEMYPWPGWFRCIVGNPFRPIDFAPWRTDTAVALARQMYDSRDFGAMPILADALQDAGCENEEVLSHCRGAGPHVRGCWVVDGVLGKE